jgi:hypothetical protein
MKKCKVCHTGCIEVKDGVIKDGLVYLLAKDNDIYLPEENYLLRADCEHGLVQFVVDEKWGFADIFTGEVKIEPVWDYAGPFYRKYAHVSLRAKVEFYSNGQTLVEGGKHGYIDKTGRVVIPVEYDAAEDIPYTNKNYFQVAKNGKWGMIDVQNKTVIPLEWDDFYQHRHAIFVGIEVPCGLHVGANDRLLSALCMIPAEPTYYHTTKWGIYDENCNLLVKPELDEYPIHYKFSDYYILKQGRRYGVLSKDGQLISDIKLFKKDAIELIKSNLR